MRDIALAIAEDDRVLEIGGGADELRKVSRLAGPGTEATSAWVISVGARGGGRDLDAHRIVQKGFGEPDDFLRHGGREEKRLPGEGNELADSLDVRDEAHVEHAVGFVDDQDFDAGQQQLAAVGKIEQPAGCRDQNVGAAHDLRFLVAEGHAADQQRDVELMVYPVAGEALFDLGGEFAGRFEDERARHSRARPPLFEARQHRQSEGGGLAGAGLGDAQHVAAGERLGNGFGLNGGWVRVTGSFYCL